MIGQTLLGKKYFQFIILTSGQKNCLVLKRRVCQRQTRKEKIWLRLRERLKLVIPRQEKKCVGGVVSETLITLAVLLGCVNETWTFRRKRGWWSCQCCQPWEQYAEGQHNRGLPGCLALMNDTLLSPWPQPPATLLGASLPVSAGAGDRGIIGWPRRSPCPLICGEWSHPRGTARWWVVMCLYL